METTIPMTEEFLRSRVSELEAGMANHKNCDYWKSENGRVQGQIIKLVDNFYENEDSAEDIISALCEIIDYEPKFTINFTATINFTGQIEINANEKESFDLEEFLQDAYVDMNHGDVIIDSYELYDASEC